MSKVAPVMVIAMTMAGCLNSADVHRFKLEDFGPVPSDHKGPSRPTTGKRSSTRTVSFIRRSPIRRRLI